MGRQVAACAPLDRFEFVNSNGIGRGDTWFHVHPGVTEFLHAKRFTPVLLKTVTLIKVLPERPANVRMMASCDSATLDKIVSVRGMHE